MFAVTFELLGAEETEADLFGIEERVERPFEDRQLFKPLQRAEQRHLVSLLPHYNRSGRLWRSLTASAGIDTIRARHGGLAQFGTKVPYARAAASRGGDRLLVVSKQAREQTARDVLRYIVEGHSG